jgi:uncharacterized membrane protein
MKNFKKIAGWGILISVLLGLIIVNCISSGNWLIGLISVSIAVAISGLLLLAVHLITS